MGRSPPKRKKLWKCLICPTRDITGFYQFPSDPDRQETWLKLCGLKVVKKADKLCYKHFLDSDFTFSNERKRLVWNSVPSLSLPLPLVPPAEVNHDLSVGEIEKGDQPMQNDDIYLNGKIAIYIFFDHFQI